ncbi:major facilitator superfamily domain-containing protein [Podospora aff. communis PSN243]|uniref:Major facilitator superfamily domain-containing protein n=1 Tax=Podospora aff. communis PSN243 TaxID=3040156 RepID=A0AAV9GDS6_9PEZI|nr:major facilitator superfamily domain-containing protein [Podospora aff. communis PSN243]
METTHKLAAPIAQGTWVTARQAFGDLFIWEQRMEVTDASGQKRTEWARPIPLKNPISLMAQLSARDWVYFIVGLSAWTADAFDFHALSIQQVKLAKYYGTTKTAISSAITLTLLLRSVGAAAFGFAGDKWGRKWPMVINMVVLGLLQIATIYSITFSQFLAVRSLFGFFMGGVYGNAIAMALENSPVDARGIMSGILQQGYSLGYVFAACANLGVGGGTESWKTVFWIAAAASIFVGLVRCCFPESRQFLEVKRAGKEVQAPTAFWKETKVMLRQEWRMCLYCSILMSWFNYYSHTSQDSYTTFMIQQKELPNAGASRASIIMKVGACVGGTILGYVSQWFGRRRTIALAAIASGLMIPAWILPEGDQALSATGFFMQFFVQGAWGAIPIHLNELSPPAFRSSFPGITYQLGNMISAPSAQIVNLLAEKNFVTSKSGRQVEAYGPIMGVATAIIATGIVVTVALGPERRGREFEKVKPAGMNVGGEERYDLESPTKVESASDSDKAGVVQFEDAPRK